MRKLTPLKFENNSFLITNRRDWATDFCLQGEDAGIAVEFARSMTIGHGEHRNHRSGGAIRRKPIEIFHDTFNGKISEIATHHWLEKNLPNFHRISELDFEVHQLGIWDLGDLTIDGVKFQVKSTKHFGNLLLLEVPDWDSNGNYLPRTSGQQSDIEGIIFVRIRPELWKIVEPKMFSENFDSLKSRVLNTTWEFNLVGFASRRDVIQIVETRQILPKNSLLQRTTLMDTDNYYLQSGDLHRMSRISDYLAFIGKQRDDL